MMNGSKWSELLVAYDESSLLSRRVVDQGLEDLISIIQFSPSAICTCRLTPISSRKIPHQHHTTMDGGGTVFNRALALTELWRRTLISAERSHTPMIVFMSDGGRCAVSAMRGLARDFAHRNLQVHTLSFQAGHAGDKLLAEMARVAGGQFHSAKNGQDLQMHFIDIATNYSAVDSLARKFGEMISDMVANKFILDFL